MSQIKVNSIVPVGGIPSGSNGGIVQVKQTFKTDHFSKSSTSYADVTGMSVTITPSSNSNKILIVVHLSYGDSGNGYAGFKLLRGSTNVGFSTALDNQSSSNTQETAFTAMSESSQGTYKLNSASHEFLDSPATTSATTYKLQIVTWSSTTFHLNRPNSIGNAVYTMGGTSSITAYEISG